MGVFNENAGRMAMSAIALSELDQRAEKRTQVAQNPAVVEELASQREVLPYAAKAAQPHGTIRAALDKARRPIGVNGSTACTLPPMHAARG
jgi:tRNA(fMet)-specific endonuclease VapC